MFNTLLLVVCGVWFLLLALSYFWDESMKLARETYDPIEHVNNKDFQ